MRLANTGRERIRFEVEDAEGDVDVTFDAGITWHPTERITHTVVWSPIIAGPDATGNPVGTVVLGAGMHGVFLRMTTEDGERVYRPAGHVQVDNVFVP